MKNWRKKKIDFRPKISIVPYLTGASVEKFIFSQSIPNMKTSKTNAFTLIELLVVISIIAILAGIALPAFTSVQVRGRQTQALSNVKQICLACKLFAMDNNGNFPNYGLDTTTLQPSSAQPVVTTANAAFAQLFPDYLTNETIFCEQGSSFTPTLADNIIDVPIQATPTQTLKKGENTFAYVLGLTDTSNALFPLVADGFADATKWTYTSDKAKPGGVWEGKKAVVGLVDGSAAVQPVNSTSQTVMHNPVTPTASYFSNSAVATTGQAWLSSPANNVVNPL
jgi:prepilin-type N-terminal cleavage/methylation domain-containing protein